MLEVIVVDRNEAREAVLDALRAKGYDMSQSAVGDAVLNVARPATAETPAEVSAQAVDALESFYEDSNGNASLYRFVLDAIETRLIQNALGRTGGNQLAAARTLGINRNTLRSHIRRLGIDVRRDDNGGDEGAARLPSTSAHTRSP